MTNKRFGEILSSISGQGGSYLKVKEDESGFEFQKTEPIGDWIQSYTYYVGDLVLVNLQVYRCKTQHTSSSVFANDSANWDLVSASSGITGSGTTNYIPKFATGTSLTNSALYDNGTNIGVGFATPSKTFDMKAGGTYGYNNKILAQADTAKNNYFFAESGNLTATGTNATACGALAAVALAGGTDLSAFGYKALNLCAGGNYNSAFGSNALSTAISTSNCSAFGYNALAVATGGNNSAFGSNALAAAGTMGNSCAFGYNALAVAANGNGSNCAFGSNALAAMTGSGAYNTAIGAYSLNTLTSGNYTTAVGAYAGRYLGASNCVAIGYFALSTAGSGNDNTAVGYQALMSANGGGENVAVGSNALDAATGGLFNVAVGKNALTNLLGNSKNTALGYSSAYSCSSSGSEIVAVGYQALYSATSSLNGCVAMGSNAAYTATAPNQLTAVGFESLYAATGGFNTAFGYQAGRTLTTGDSNLFVGKVAGYNTLQKVNAVNSICIGADTYTTASNQLILGKSIKYAGLGTFNPQCSLELEDSSSVGSDLVLNGNFTSDTTNWTASNATLASVTGGFSGNCLQVTNDSANYGYGYQAITTVPNTRYIVSYYFKKGTAVGGQILIGSTAAGSYDLYNKYVTDASWTAYSVEVIAPGNTIYISLQNNSNVSGETTLWDNIATKEVTGGNLIANGTIRAVNGFVSRPGNPGITTTITTASLVGKTITIENGLIVGFA